MNLVFFKKNIIYVIIGSIVCAASICYLLLVYDWQDVFHSLLNVQYLTLILQIWGVHFFYIILRTSRFFILVRRFNAKIPFEKLYFINAVVLSLAVLTPGQLGEVLKIELLKRQNLLDRLSGFGGFAIERFMDLLVITTIACLGGVWTDTFANRYPVFLFGGGVLFIILLATFLLTGRKFFYRGLPLRNGSSTLWVWGRIFILTLLSWGCVIWAWSLILAAAKVHLGMWQVAWLVSLVTVGVILSLMPGGIGVADMLTVELLVEMGIMPMMAQGGAILLRFYALILVGFGLIHILGYGFFYFMKNRRFTNSY